MDTDADAAAGPRAGPALVLWEARSMSETIVLPALAPQRAELEAAGWSVTARSFGAQLDAERIDEQRLTRLIADAVGPGSVRELDADDVDAVLDLDAATAHDYPGSVATQHAPLDRSTATPAPARRAFGVFMPAGGLVAMTFVDVDGADAETSFTAVHRAWRRRGLGSAVKAASVLALRAGGVRRFRTGGSAENAAILRSNGALGYVRDEEWVTLERPTPPVEHRCLGLGGRSDES